MTPATVTVDDAVTILEEFLRGEVVPRLSVTRQEDGVAGPLEDVSDQGAEEGVVVDTENANVVAGMAWRLVRGLGRGIGDRLTSDCHVGSSVLISGKHCAGLFPSSRSRTCPERGSASRAGAADARRCPGPPHALPR